LVGGVVSVGDEEDVALDILFYDEPGAAAEAKAFALSDGVEPVSVVLSDGFAGVAVDDVAGELSEVAL